MVCPRTLILSYRDDGTNVQNVALDGRSVTGSSCFCSFKTRLHSRNRVLQKAERAC
jgi:hypothetical protein